MTTRLGRPMKYAHFLAVLEDDKLYCPSTIVANGERLGFFPRGLSKQALRLKKTRVRISLGRYSWNHDFPVGGDGLVFVDGQAPIPGWFGKRWKRF